MLTVSVTIMTIMGGIYAVFTVIVTIMTIMGKFICSAYSYSGNNGEVYVQCEQSL